MSTANKINIFLATLVVCLLLSVGVLAKLAWDQHELEQANSQLNEQLMEANLEIGKAETRFGKAKAELEKELQDWIDKYNEQVDAYGELEARYNVVAESPAERVVYVTGTTIHVGPDGGEVVPGIYLAETPDQVTHIPGGFEYTASDHRADITCRVNTNTYGILDDAWIRYDIHLTLGGELLKTSTKSGATNYYMNLWELDDEGNRLTKLELKTFTVTTIDERAPQMFWWAPHLDISGFAALGKGLTPQWGAAIGVSAMGYGLTENDLQFRFLNLSMDLGSSLGVGFTPAQYNLGTHIPLISNLWVGPHVGFNIDQEWYAGIALGAML